MEWIMYLRIKTPVFPGKASKRVQDVWKIQFGAIRHGENGYRFTLWRTPTLGYGSLRNGL